MIVVDEVASVTGGKMASTMVQTVKRMRVSRGAGESRHDQHGSEEGGKAEGNHSCESGYRGTEEKGVCAQHSKTC